MPVRGDIVTVALSGDFGKPRPALVIQADRFAGTSSTTVLLLSSTLVDAPLLRVDLVPSPANGLRLPSQIAIDKTMTVRRDRLGRVIGKVDGETMLAINRLLSLFLGFA